MVMAFGLSGLSLTGSTREILQNTGASPVLAAENKTLGLLQG